MPEQTFKLRDQSKTTPKGFLWVDPITGLEAVARSHPNWMSAAREIRMANALELPKVEEMEDQLCKSMTEKSRQDWCMPVDLYTPRPGGPGTILKDLLSGFRIKACWGCLDLAGKMDTWGPDGCEENMQYIVDAMKANAEQKKWFRFAGFLAAGIEPLVRLAIAKSREQNDHRD